MGVVAVLLFFPSIVFSAEPPGPSKIAAIRFEGLVHTNAEALETRLASQPGEPYNPLKIRQDLRTLATLVQRAQVRIDPASAEGEIEVTFNVEEFPALREIQIVGNKTVSTAKLEKIIGLEEGDFIDPREVASLRRAVLKEHARRGLAAAKVEVKVTKVMPTEIQVAQAGDTMQPLQDGPSPVNVQVFIDEGEPIRTDDVVIEGNEVFSGLRLRSKLQTKGSWLFFKNFYNDDAFEVDLALLRQFYHSRGYFDALIERGPFEKRQVKDELLITPVIRVREGGRYTLGQVDVVGASLFARHDLLAPFEDLLNEPYEEKKVFQALREVQSLYFDAGFLTTEIQPVRDYDLGDHRLGLTIEIKEGQRIYVGDIRLERPQYEIDDAPTRFQEFYEGIAPPITDDAIQREILLEPGAAYSARDERETVRRLEGLGVFSDVQVVNEPTADPRVHDVRIYVEEQQTGDLFGGVGFGDASGLFGFVTFNERNLFGDARDFRTRVQLGTRASSFYVSYTDRYYKETEDRVTVAAFYNTYARPGYDEDTIGLSLERGRKLETSNLLDGWDGAVRGRLEFKSLSERNSDPDEDLDVSYPVITARVMVGNDTSYPRTNPREGRSMMGSVEAGYAGGPLLKFVGSAVYHRAISKNVTYHFKPTVGVIPYNSDAVGISERFFMGGSEDLRGFAFRGAGRRDKDDDDVGIGGAVKLLVRNEISFPLLDTGLSEHPIQGVVFLDAGLLGASPVSYETPRASTGVGIRMTFGGRVATTAAIDLAVPLIKKSGDDTQFLHFRFDSSL